MRFIWRLSASTLFWGKSLTQSSMCHKMSISAGHQHPPILWLPCSHVVQNWIGGTVSSVLLIVHVLVLQDSQFRKQLKCQTPLGSINSEGKVMQFFVGGIHQISNVFGSHHKVSEFTWGARYDRYIYSITCSIGWSFFYSYSAINRVKPRCIV